MPVYTYRCETCGVQFDITQKFSDSSLTRCPECGKKTLRKVYQPVGIVFKGSGFYSTDHKSPSGQSRYSVNNSENKAAEAAAKESKDGQSGSTEAKPVETSKASDQGGDSKPASGEPKK